MTAHFELKFLAGTDILTACTEAIRIAGLLGVTVDFFFNDVKVFAKPGVSPQALADAWGKELSKPGSQLKIAVVHPEQRVEGGEG